LRFIPQNKFLSISLMAMSRDMSFKKTIFPTKNSKEKTMKHSTRRSKLFLAIGATLFGASIAMPAFSDPTPPDFVLMGVAKGATANFTQATKTDILDSDGWKNISLIGGDAMTNSASWDGDVELTVGGKIDITGAITLSGGRGGTAPVGDPSMPSYPTPVWGGSAYLISHGALNAGSFILTAANGEDSSANVSGMSAGEVSFSHDAAEKVSIKNNLELTSGNGGANATTTFLKPIQGGQGGSIKFKMSNPESTLEVGGALILTQGIGTDQSGQFNYSGGAGV
jgi:hypothetical protein